jgi:hypothetical protein
MLLLSFGFSRRVERALVRLPLSLLLQPAFQRAAAAAAHSRSRPAALAIEIDRLIIRALVFFQHLRSGRPLRLRAPAALCRFALNLLQLFTLRIRRPRPRCFHGRRTLWLVLRGAPRMPSGTPYNLCSDAHAKRQRHRHYRRKKSHFIPLTRTAFQLIRSPSDWKHALCHPLTLC